MSTNDCDNEYLIAEPFDLQLKIWLSSNFTITWQNIQGYHNQQYLTLRLREIKDKITNHVRRNLYSYNSWRSLPNSVQWSWRIPWMRMNEKKRKQWEFKRIYEFLPKFDFAWSIPLAWGILIRWRRNDLLCRKNRLSSKFNRSSRCAEKEAPIRRSSLNNCFHTWEHTNKGICLSWNILPASCLHYWK